ncbi:MAG TPA: YciI family protein [Candidatus Tumulicola sp.]|jgi:hypothetical protein
MSEFLYLYRGGKQPEDPAEGQKVMQKWVAWMKSLTDAGKLKDPGQPLEPGGKVVKNAAGSITDGPYAEAKDLVGGFTVVETADIDEACRLAAGCPIFDAGGIIEVRPILNMGM